MALTLAAPKCIKHGGAADAHTQGARSLLRNEACVLSMADLRRVRSRSVRIKLCQEASAEATEVENVGCDDRLGRVAVEDARVVDDKLQVLHKFTHRVVLLRLDLATNSAQIHRLLHNLVVVLNRVGIHGLAEDFALWHFEQPLHNHLQSVIDVLHGHTRATLLDNTLRIWSLVQLCLLAHLHFSLALLFCVVFACPLTQLREVHGDLGARVATADYRRRLLHLQLQWFRQHNIRLLL
ncbi:hypothetical protein GQ600_16360 [Phytophthora cactorum]|nr:hypothetical protein GQ600_16360 [Phytophthora cactorum]